MFIGDTATNHYGEVDVESADERILYRYIAQLAQLPPNDALAKHHLLITEANAQGNQQVEQALQRILLDEKWERNGRFILNRCFYGMRNPWLASGDRAEALRELIVRVRREAPYREASSRHLRRLRQALSDYVNSDQYLALEWNLRLMKVGDYSPCSGDGATQPKLRDRFQDQFYLHEVLTATPDIPRQQQQELRRLVCKRAKTIHSQLYTYLKTGAAPQKIIRYREFGNRRTFDDYLHQVRPDRDNSIWQVASRFAARVKRMSLDAICQEIYRFVLEPLAQVNDRFNPDSNSALQGQIRREINRGRENPQGGGNQFTEMAVTSICSHLLKLLVVESPQRCSATYFKRLLDQVGHAAVTEMLLRITLFWPKVRFVLEERFGILLHVHQNRSNDEVPWLTKSLEYLKVGLALNGNHLGYFYDELETTA